MSLNVIGCSSNDVHTIVNISHVPPIVNDVSAIDYISSDVIGHISDDVDGIVSINDVTHVDSGLCYLPFDTGGTVFNSMYTHFCNISCNQFFDFVCNDINEFLFNFDFTALFATNCIFKSNTNFNINYTSICISVYIF
jgi:hypothetical protein